MRFKECMWTRNNIRQLIWEKYGVDIKLSTLGYYLARWGFTVQRPVKRGKLHFLLYKDSMNSEKLIDFMTRLVADNKKKVFLILDNLRVHHSKAVTAWLEDHKNQIELFFLPPYAPEYNPDELLNSGIKRNAGAKQSPRTQAELEANVQSHLAYLTAKPDHVASFFHATLTSYV